MIDVMHLSFFRKTRNTDDGRSSSSSFSAFVSAAAAELHSIEKVQLND